LCTAAARLLHAGGTYLPRTPEHHPAPPAPQREQPAVPEPVVAGTGRPWSYAS